MRDRWLADSLYAFDRRSAFFIVVYCMFRGLLYGSYRKPRATGCLALAVLMGEALRLPVALGADVVWGAQVIVILRFLSLVRFVLIIRGDFVVGDTNRSSPSMFAFRSF
jgi:ubiquinol-cytochrome c reductase cytochrome b subunit